MKVEVTAEDITKGERQSPILCPIAWACWRSFLLELGDSIRVGPINVFIDKLKGETHKYLLPTPAREFIHRFDNGLTVEPITFELERV